MAINADMNKQTTFCYCPKCQKELVSSKSFISDHEFVTFKCINCQEKTVWDFSLPVPILIKGDNFD